MGHGMMTEPECVALLQRVLPDLGLRWRGFKNVRRQVVRRVTARARELGLDAAAYEERLRRSDQERSHFDSLCYVTISRFYRDRQVYDALRERFLPALGRERQNRAVRVWSAGCANGEEPYTLSILWELANGGSARTIEIVATDFNQAVLRRASEATYERGSFRELPAEWHALAFEEVAPQKFRVRERFRRSVTFLQEDIRLFTPEPSVDIVMCRNLAFTYFGEEAQRAFLDRVVTVLAQDALLVIGSHEALPATETRFRLIEPHIYLLKSSLPERVSR